MFHKRALIIAASALAISFRLTLVVGYLLEEVRLQSPLPARVEATARSDVATNNEWEPVVRRTAGLDMALVPHACSIVRSMRIL